MRAHISLSWSISMLRLIKVMKRSLFYGSIFNLTFALLDLVGEDKCSCAYIFATNVDGNPTTVENSYHCYTTVANARVIMCNIWRECVEHTRHDRLGFIIHTYQEQDMITLTPVCEYLFSKVWILCNKEIILEYDIRIFMYTVIELFLHNIIVKHGRIKESWCF